jgi:hypothetical protein
MPTLFVISDLRQPNEKMFAHVNMIPAIKMESDLFVRLERIKRENDNFNMESLIHETEIWLDLLTADFTIENNSSVGVLKIKKLYRKRITPIHQGNSMQIGG